MYAVVVAFTCTFFVFCNVPVYWPILALYFIVLFSYTMKRQIMVRTNVYSAVVASYQVSRCTYACLSTLAAFCQ